MQHSSSGADADIQKIRSLMSDLNQQLDKLTGENQNGLAQEFQALRASLERFRAPAPSQHFHALFEIKDDEKRFLETLFQSGPDGVAVVTYPDMIYRAANQAFQRMTPRPELEALGQTMEAVWPERDIEGTRVVFGQILMTGESINTDYQYLGPEGLRFYTARIMPIRWMGSPALLQVFWETTELQKTLQHVKESERRLKESDQYLQSILDGMPDLIWSASPDGGTEYMNKPLQEFTGMNLEQMRQAGWMNVYHPDDAERIAKVWERVSQTGESFEEEYRYRNKDGEYVWFWGSAYPIKDASGNIQKWVGVSRDISERKRVQQIVEKASASVIEERNRLQVVMETAPVGLAIYDMNGGIIQANKSFESVWGESRPVVQSLEDYERYSAWWIESGNRVQPDEWASVLALQGETTIGQYMRIQKFDGSPAFILNSGAPVKDASGKVTGAVVAIMDVSQYVQAEQALRETQGRFRVALSALPMMVYMMDDKLRYTWVYNPHPVYREKNFLGKQDVDLFPPEVAKPFILPKQQVLDTGESVQREVTAQIDNEMKTYLLTLEPLFNSRRKVVGLIGASLDVSDQKRIQKERLDALTNTMVQRQLLENREKERQAIARDLHDGPIQLLSSTLFNLQIVKEALDDAELQVELTQASTNLKSVVRNLRSLMNELRPPALIRFGFAKSALMHAEDFREQNRDMKLYLQLLDQGELLSEDAHLALFRIYQESLNNIVKHAKATKVWVQLNRKENMIRLQIHDNGQGFHVPNDLSSQVKNQHYGLAGIKERAEALGGEFKILSVVGVGTTILVSVPIVEVDELRG